MTSPAARPKRFGAGGTRLSGTTVGQLRRRFRGGDLRPGDLVFFRLDGRKVSHVGVYLGGQRFVHAPQSGRPVREARLDAEYFAERYAGAGRMWR